MSDIAEKVKRATAARKAFKIGPADELFMFSCLNLNDFESIKDSHGVNFMSSKPDDIKLTPEVIRTMIKLALDEEYPDITDRVVGQLMTTAFMTSANFTGVIAHMQGADEKEVEHQVERFRADQDRRRLEAAEAEREAEKAAKVAKSKAATEKAQPAAAAA